MDDPLDAIFAWPNEVRKNVAMALKPYVKIQSHDGSILWLTTRGNKPEQDRIAHLAKAVAYEVLGTPRYKSFKLSSESAAEMANKIWMSSAANAIE